MHKGGPKPAKRLIGKTEDSTRTQQVVARGRSEHREKGSFAGRCFQGIKDKGGSWVEGNIKLTRKGHGGITSGQRPEYQIDFAAELGERHMAGWPVASSSRERACMAWRQKASGKSAARMQIGSKQETCKG